MATITGRRTAVSSAGVQTLMVRQSSLAMGEKSGFPPGSANAPRVGMGSDDWGGIGPKASASRTPPHGSGGRGALKRC